MSYNLLDIIKNKVPLFALFIQILIVNIFYKECVLDELHIIGFWIYFPILSLFCLLWEFVTTIKVFSVVYYYKTINSRLIFGSFSALISLSTFCCSSYYIETGKPFSCVFQYNE